MNEIKITHLKPNSQKTETWIAMIENEIVGHIFMEKEVDNKIKFLDAWVHDNHRRKVEGRPCSVMTTAAATTARLDRELKVPKFKRCKISRQQLYVLLTNFGARRSCPAPHSNLISP